MVVVVNVEKRLIVMDVHGLVSYTGMPEYIDELKNNGNRIIFWTKGKRAIDAYQKLACEGLGGKWSLNSEIIFRIPFRNLRTEFEGIIARKSFPIVANDTLKYFEDILDRYKNGRNLGENSRMVIKRFYPGNCIDFLERFRRWPIEAGGFYKDPDLFSYQEKTILIESDEAEKTQDRYQQRNRLPEWEVPGLNLIIMPERRAIDEEKQNEALRALKTYLGLWQECHVDGLKVDIPNEIGLSDGKLYRII